MDAPITPREQMLRDILTTAVEGGITYWANDLAFDSDRPREARLQVFRIERAEDLSVTAVVFNCPAVQDVAGSLATIAAFGTRDGDRLTIDTKALNKALKAITQGKVTWGGKQHPEGRMVDLARRAVFAFNDPTRCDDLACDIDAGDADNLLQAALFGDVVYG